MNTQPDEKDIFSYSDNIKNIFGNALTDNKKVSVNPSYLKRSELINRMLIMMMHQQFEKIILDSGHEFTNAESFAKYIVTQFRQSVPECIFIFTDAGAVHQPKFVARENGAKR